MLVAITGCMGQGPDTRRGYVSYVEESDEHPNSTIFMDDKAGAWPADFVTALDVARRNEAQSDFEISETDKRTVERDLEARMTLMTDDADGFLHWDGAHMRVVYWSN